MLEQPGQYYTYKVYDAQNNIVDALLPKGNANMFWVFNRLTGPGSGFLFQDDIDGIRALYGSGSGGVFPLAVPEPASTTIAALSFFVLLASRHRCR
jgi:hypothetical protein